MHEAHDGLKGVDLNLVLALDALLAERHVTRAATRLGITQSAASHALARLRELIGDPLLVRGARGVMVPTPRAEALAPQIHRVLADLSGALRGETFDPATAKRTFRIGASDYVELVLLPRLIERLARLAPNIDIWIHAGYAEHGDAELAAGGIDLAIGPPQGTMRAAGSYEKVLFDESFTCIVREDHALAGGRMTLARYCAASHLLIAPRSQPGSYVDSALVRLGRTRRIALAVPHFLVVPYIIAGTDLVATIATRVAALFADRLGLATMPPPIPIPKFQIALAWHERNHGDAPQRWLRDQLVAVANEIR